MSKRKRSIFRIILSYMFSFFVAVSLATLCISIMLSNGLFNKETFFSGFSASNFYDEKIEQLDNNLAARLDTAGLPVECAEDVFIPGAVTVDINNSVKHAINSQNDGSLSIDVKKPGIKLRSNIEKYLTSKGVKITSDVRKAIDLIITETEKDYQSQLSFGFINKFYGFFNKYDSIVSKVKIVSLIVLVVSSLAILFLRSRIYRGVRLIECGLFSGTVLTFIVSYVMKHDIIKYMPADDGAYGRFISSFISKSFSHEKYIIMIGLLLVVLLNIVNRYLKKRVI